MDEEKMMTQQGGANGALPAAAEAAGAAEAATLAAATLQTLDPISYAESLTHKQVREAINKNSTRANANFTALNGAQAEMGNDVGMLTPVKFSLESPNSTLSEVQGFINGYGAARYGAETGQYVPIWGTGGTYGYFMGSLMFSKYVIAGATSPGPFEAVARVVCSSGKVLKATYNVTTNGTNTVTGMTLEGIEEITEITANNDVVKFPYVTGSLENPTLVSQETIDALNNYIVRHGIVLYYDKSEYIIRIPIEDSSFGYLGCLELFVGNGIGVCFAAWIEDGFIKKEIGTFGYENGKITQMFSAEYQLFLFLTKEEKAKYEQAVTDASAADAKATSAQNVAQEANSKATNAQTAAQTAVSQSATAKSAADTAQTTANDALKAVDGFVKNVLTFTDVTTGTYSPGSGELSFTSVTAQAGDEVVFCAIINNGGSTRGGGTFLLKRGNTRYINWKRGGGIEASTEYNAVTADVTSGTFTTRSGIVQNRVFISTKTAQVVVCQSGSSDGFIIR